MNSKYRIAIIAGQLVVGGAERQLYLWLSKLDREKFHPIVLTLHPGHGDYWEKPIETLGINILRIQHHDFPVLRLINIVRELISFKPDLIQGWHLFASPYAGLSAKILGGKSLGGIRGTYQTFKNSRLEAGLTLCLTDAILANSFSAAQQLRKSQRYFKKTIYAVQNAVIEPLEQTESIRIKISQRYNISLKHTWIGSVGRLDPKKRFDLLLKVIKLLVEENNKIHLILVGDGAERLHLETLVRELELEEYVTMTGEVPGASSWLQAFDIFCFTSLDEGIPNVVMEAAMAGNPIVTWRLPFIEEILRDREHAWLLDPLDLVGFKDALVSLINSPTTRKQLGQSAQTHMIENFTINRYVQEMTEVYYEILGHPGDQETVS